MGRIASRRGFEGARFTGCSRLAAALVFLAAVHALPAGAPNAAAATLGYVLVDAYAHDPGAFTQGLVYRRGLFYESTGLHGASSLRRVDSASGELLDIVPLADELFGEGLTLLDGRLVQLTWLSRRGFVYDVETLARTGEFAYPTEGWGITHDDVRLIMSDGTEWLYFLDPASFARTGQIAVHDADGAVTALNELEYIDGRVFANVYKTNRIIAIDPATGRVTGSLDLGDLTRRERRIDPRAGVLNGIAHDPRSGQLFVTGKHWTSMYVIRLLGTP